MKKIRFHRAPEDPPGPLWPALGGLLAGTVLMGMPDTSHAAPLAPLLGDETLPLDELSLEELLGVEVSVATRSEEPYSMVPAAVYVLTGDEIRRAGHSSIPEALRMVPGFYVSHWTTGAWDVTSRGFGPGEAVVNAAFLNQLLVMVDGVVVYSPLFAGTWWPLLDLNLADVERIEIVRGPGGILWGSNAVHGVVHVITKHAQDTQGLLVHGSAATDDRHGTLRYGGRVGEDGFVRAWVKRADYDTLANPFAGLGQDWNLNSAGMRADWTSAEREFLVWSRGYFGDFETSVFDSLSSSLIEDVADKSGLQLFGSMRDPERGSTWQAWITSDRQDIPQTLDQDIQTLDLEYHRELPFGADHRVLFGAGYRLIHSDLVGDPSFATFEPETQSQHILRAFAVGTLALRENLELVAGLTLERNSFTHFEVQPTVRTVWSPGNDWTAWASVSRAVRTPSLEENSLAPDAPIAGNSDFRAEVLWAYEAGVRKLFSPRVSADLAVFYNDYDHLHSIGFDTLSGQPFFDNEAEGTAYGAELALDAQPHERWNLRSAVAILQGDYEEAGVDLTLEDQHPKRQLNLRSYLDLGHDFELDGAVYVVDDLGGAQTIAEYTRADLRLGWNPSQALRLFVGVQNLNQSTHSEYDEFDNTRRSVFFGFSLEP